VLTEGMPPEPARVRPLAVRPVIDSRGAAGVQITYSY